MVIKSSVGEGHRSVGVLQFKIRWSEQAFPRRWCFREELNECGLEPWRYLGEDQAQGTGKRPVLPWLEWGYHRGWDPRSNRELDHNGLCSHCKSFLSVMYGKMERSDSGGIYSIGIYGIFLDAVWRTYWILDIICLDYLLTLSLSLDWRKCAWLPDYLNSTSIDMFLGNI